MDENERKYVTGDEKERKYVTGDEKERKYVTGDEKERKSVSDTGFGLFGYRPGLCCGNTEENQLTNQMPNQLYCI